MAMLLRRYHKDEPVDEPKPKRAKASKADEKPAPASEPAAGEDGEK